MSRRSENAIRDILQKRKWLDLGLSDLELIVIDRASPRGYREISGDSIVEFDKSYIYVGSRESRTQIPYHRVLMVIDRREGRVLWERKRL